MARASAGFSRIAAPGPPLPPGPPGPPGPAAVPEGFSAAGAALVVLLERFRSSFVAEASPRPWRRGDAASRLRRRRTPTRPPRPVPRPERPGAATGGATATAAGAAVRERRRPAAHSRPPAGSPPVPGRGPGRVPKRPSKGRRWRRAAAAPRSRPSGPRGGVRGRLRLRSRPRSGRARPSPAGRSRCVRLSSVRVLSRSGDVGPGLGSGEGVGPSLGPGGRGARSMLDYDASGSEKKGPLSPRFAPAARGPRPGADPCPAAKGGL